MSKLSYEDKINLYNDSKLGLSKSAFLKKYNISIHSVQYLYYLIDKHGFDILRTTKNKEYPKQFKENAIDRVLINKEAILGSLIRYWLTR